mmetsp:Transcript_38879/g.59081  ORF Transcript_38879/g.59081 Transcript_38879/m.59081 type:complete len:81 (-) Transcript_38879:91-333(-)|eukprot:CAMPEP_0170490938 /NCGR_PEP_ID=MMETSP0208-20121228/10073_1 /TAXON_ID=197538 /ORGANISM="Strombidium inclinatum, Strain S3" /LENGTH=80 /DNA_ID=CAMNT_0010766427 /DNA_START=59 /DNA_END=301 /DNA_ORIENTATION=+
MTNTKRNTPYRKLAQQKRAERKAGDHTELIWSKYHKDINDETRKDELTAFEKHAQWKQFGKLRPIKSDKIVFRTGVKATM